MEEKNKKKRLLYMIIGVIVLLSSVGGVYAYFSSAIRNNNTISGNTQDIDDNSLRLSVTKVEFNDIDTSLVPSNDLVPAYFGLDNDDNLNVANPSQLKLSNVENMIENKCVNTSEGYTGCHVYKIAMSADQDIAHVNLLLGLTVNDHSTSDVSVVDKSQWGYVVFTASDNNSSTGVVGSGTQTLIADGEITNLTLNSAGHGAPRAIGDGLVSSPADNRIDIHNNQKLIGCESAGLPQEVVYYLLVYLNDTDISQNESINGNGNDNYAVGSYSGTLELQALGGKVRANFGPDAPDGTLMSRVVLVQSDFDENGDGIVDENDVWFELKTGLFGNQKINTQNIVNVYTVNHTSIPENAIEFWDASEEQNGSVMAWIINNEYNNGGNIPGSMSYDYNSSGYYYEDVYAKPLVVSSDPINPDPTITGYYDLYIGQVKGVNANPNSHSLFKMFTDAEKIDLINLNTSKVTNMGSMFYNCGGLTSIDVSNFNTSNVTDMSGMFNGCNNLRSLDLSSFNTSNVTKMDHMFDKCSSLTSLDLSNFNTSNVTDMNSMFIFCTNLTSLNLSGFDTSNVTNMSSMFYNCNSLTSLDLSNFNTSNVTDMGNMFIFCTNLTSLNLSGFDTSNVTNMSSMFDTCENLTSLDLSNFNTSNVTHMGSMFSGCRSLTSLDLSSFDTSKLTYMYGMFNNCNSLTSLDLSSFNTSSVESMAWMFFGCNSLTSLDLSNLDTSKLTDFSLMFAGCKNLTSVTCKEEEKNRICNIINSTSSNIGPVTINGSMQC